MKKQKYVINLVPKDMAKKWSKDQEEAFDIKVLINKRTGRIRAKLGLNFIEAICFRKAIKKYNKLHNTKMVLRKEAKHKAKRYRV